MNTRPPDPPPALRVGLLGAAYAAAIECALVRLGRIARDRDAATVLRLLRVVLPGSISRPDLGGWQTHWVSRVALPEAAGLLSLDGAAAFLPGAEDGAAACVVRNCDLLVIAGDARSPALDAPVRQALQLGVPLLWLADDGTVQLLTDRGWRVSLQAAPAGEAAWTALERIVRAMLDDLPDTAAFDATLLEANVPPHWLWQSHRWVMNVLNRAPAQPDGSPAPPDYWRLLYDCADRLAGAYADRYRSAYTLVLALAAMALAAAVLGLGHDARGEPLLRPAWTAVPEALCLAGIIGLVRASSRHRWQSRMIACRTLAELCRKQAALSLVARSLPAAGIAPLTQEGDLGWVGRRFAAAVRAAPFLEGTLAGARLGDARDAASAILLQGQRAYHAARAAAGRKREDRLVWLGSAAFTVTVVCVVIKLALLVAGSERAETFGLVAALLPAFAAAFFGLRAYAELELMVRHSKRMLGVIKAAAARLARIDVGQPEAGGHVGSVLEETAVTMLADVEGWIQISRVKTVEAG